MQKSIAEQINNHEYPPIFHKYPQLLVHLHRFMFLTILRYWYVHFHLFFSFKKLSRKEFKYMEAGCGASDFIMPYTRLFKKGFYWGVDILESNVKMGAAFCEIKKIRNAKFKTADISQVQLPEKMDMIACIGVIQAIKEDVAVLRNLNSNLKTNGTLMLYVPVYNRRLLPLYSFLIRKYPNLNYNATNESDFHDYTPEELNDKLELSGFKISRKIFTYGFFGQIGYEINQLLMFVSLLLPSYLLILAVPLWIIFNTINAIFYLIDFLLPLKKGNGILIFANKI